MNDNRPANNPYAPRYVEETEGSVINAPRLLEGGLGASWLPDFVATQVDRSIYAATEGGSGNWAFGSLRTPQRWMVDTVYGFDPEAHEKVDPNWNKDEASKFWGAVPDEMRVAVSYLGGDELAKDILENSVSRDHMFQRLKEAEVVAKARIAIDEYDSTMYVSTGALHKTFSAAVNYVFSDPSTAVSFIGTGYMAAAKLGTAAAVASNAAGRTSAVSQLISGNRLSQGIANMSMHYNKTWRTATYVWDGLDGASSAYSSVEQLNNDGFRLYGDTFVADDNYTDDVAFGAVMGLGFAAGFDAFGSLFSAAGRGTKSKSPVSTLENVAANSSEGTLNTVADAAAMSRFRQAKSNLEKALDLTEGPESETRRILMDDNTRDYLGYGSIDDMDDLAQWITTNKPSAAELDEYVGTRLKARAENAASALEWRDEASMIVENGGSEQDFFRKKAFDMLRTHMGEEAEKFRFIVDYLEEATGDARIVAEWMARGDKERIVRAANAVNANSAIAKFEGDALSKAAARVKDAAQAAERDAAEQSANRLVDNVRQGRWRGAVDILNEMHDSVMTRHGELLGRADAAINALNDAFTRLNDEAFEKLDSFKEMSLALKKFRDTIDSRRSADLIIKRRASKALDPSLDNSEVLMLANDDLGAVVGSNVDLGVAFREFSEARAKFVADTEALKGTLDEVRRTRMEIVGSAGRDALDRVMEEVGGFPLWKASLSEEGYNALRRTAIRQTKTTFRWKVNFVDRFLGENATDNALSTGTVPMRPVITERAPIKPLTLAEQDQVLREELAKVEPKIAQILDQSKDSPLEARIAAADRAIADLQAKLESGTAMRGRLTTSEGKKKLEELISRREKLLKRTVNLRKRLQNKLDTGLEVLNRDVVPPSAEITESSLRQAKLDVAKARHTEAADKLSRKSAEELATSSGRKLRNDVRRLAAEAGGGTEYNVLSRVVEAINGELTAARARVDELIGKGSLDGDAALRAARNEVEYLEKQLAKNRDKVQAIDNRPAAMRRSHQLNGNNPKVEDVVELSRLRAQIAHAVEIGDEDFAHELNKRLYNRFGDVTALPRWVELEDFFFRRTKDALDGNPTEELLTVSMDGRNVNFSVAEKPVGDVADRLGVAENLRAGAKEEPGVPRGESEKFKSKTEGRREAASKRAMLQRLVDSVESDPEAVAARSKNESARAIRYGSGSPLGPTGGTGLPVTPAKTNPMGAVAEASKEEARKATIKEKLFGGTGGERLLVMNGAINAMGSIPALRNLGRTLMQFTTAGTKFGDMHRVSRASDMIVAAFNMLDRPEPLVKSLGRNTGSLRSLQNFKDQSRIAINEVAARLQEARRSGDWTGESDVRVQDALDSGSTDGLNPGELAVHEVILRHYRSTGESLNRVRPGIAGENYRAREANGSYILANQQAAHADFSAVYAERLMSDQPLPNDLADRLGIMRGTSWSSLNPSSQAAFEAAVREHANQMATQTIARVTNGITESGDGFRFAGAVPSSVEARRLEDAVARDPRIRRWYIQSPVEEFRRYMEVRAPQIMFDGQISEVIGSPSSFEEVIETLMATANELPPGPVRNEMESAIRTLQSKWEYATGRVQYNPIPILDPAVRIGTGIVRGSSGAFWGLAGLVTELPRSIGAARMYGGGMRGIMDALYAIRNANNLDVMEDIAHATDQYSTHAHSSFGTSVGTSVGDRLLAPWERFWSVVSGREIVNNGSEGMGRATGSAVAFFEAYGETGMRLGGMQVISGICRVIADRQAKRFLTRNIDRIVDLANRIDAIGEVAENTPEARAAFKGACSEAGIPWDVAVQMNHAGLLNRNVVEQLRNGLAGSEPVFNLRSLRGRVDDRTMGSLMNYLTAAHNFHVPTSSLATNVESSNAISKLFYNLTSYSRAFSLNVGFRSAANSRMSSMMTTYAAVAIGENIYQTVRDIALGRAEMEDVENEWNEDPVKFFTKRAVKTPWLGAHNGLAMSALSSIGIGEHTNVRGNGMMQPMIDAVNKASRMVYANEKTGERDFTFLQTYTPLVNTWWSRLMLGPLER